MQRVRSISPDSLLIAQPLQLTDIRHAHFAVRAGLVVVLHGGRVVGAVWTGRVEPYGPELLRVSKEVLVSGVDDP